MLNAVTMLGMLVKGHVMFSQGLSKKLNQCNSCMAHVALGYGFAHPKVHFFLTNSCSCPFPTGLQSGCQSTAAAGLAGSPAPLPSRGEPPNALGKQALLDL